MEGLGEPQEPHSRWALWGFGLTGWNSLGELASIQAFQAWICFQMQAAGYPGWASAPESATGDRCEGAWKWNWWFCLHCWEWYLTGYLPFWVWGSVCLDLNYERCDLSSCVLQDTLRPPGRRFRVRRQNVCGMCWPFLHGPLIRLVSWDP